MSDRGRRLLAFLVDRVVLGSLHAVVLAVAYASCFRDGRWGAGLLVTGAGVALAGLATAYVVGRWGTSVGKALVGLRVVSSYDGRPIGLGPAVVRATLLGLAFLPTLGLGLALIVWSALVDPSGRRRGWHDLVAGSVVLDLRAAAPTPVPVVPQGMVNLTAQLARTGLQ